MRKAKQRTDAVLVKLPRVREQNGEQENRGDNGIERPVKRGRAIGSKIDEEVSDPLRDALRENGGYTPRHARPRDATWAPPNLSQTSSLAASPWILRTKSI